MICSDDFEIKNGWNNKPYTVENNFHSFLCAKNVSWINCPNKYVNRKSKLHLNETLTISLVNNNVFTETSWH